jgi:hypothetical protein
VVCVGVPRVGRSRARISKRRDDGCMIAPA